MRLAVFDVEATGLLPHMLRDPNAKIHCLMAMEFEVKDDEFIPTNKREFYDEVLPVGRECGWDRLPLSSCCSYLTSCDAIAGHNIIGYDLPVLSHHLGFEYSGQILDSLVISRKNFPDRPGGHSVEAWAPRLQLGLSKQEHEDWTTFSPEMRERCRSDVEIESEILMAVLQEMWKGVEKCQ